MFSDVSASIDLTGLNCNTLPYLCVRVLKGNNPSPNFVLTGSTVDCIPSQCKGMLIVFNFLGPGGYSPENKVYATFRTPFFILAFHFLKTHI